MKGYSIEGLTRIIYRYLPPEVGELVIYYLWLVIPFYRQLQLLVFSENLGSTECWLPLIESSLLWGTSHNKP